MSQLLYYSETIITAELIQKLRPVIVITTKHPAAALGHVSVVQGSAHGTYGYVIIIHDQVTFLKF
jgi:hypothetical protein